MQRCVLSTAKRVAVSVGVVALTMGLVSPTAASDAGKGDVLGTALTTATVDPSFSPASGLNNMVFTTAEGVFDSLGFNQGWWSDRDSNCCGNDNYLVGFTGDQASVSEHRDFFTFDLAPLQRRVVSAQLRVRNPLRGGPTEDQRLALYDVLTPAQVVNNNEGRNAAIFEDLGSGVTYGTFDVPSGSVDQVLQFSLNRAAIRDINAAAGDYFTIGGRGVYPGLFIFAGSGRVAARLVVKFMPV